MQTGQGLPCGGGSSSWSPTGMTPMARIGAGRQAESTEETRNPWREHMAGTDEGGTRASAGVRGGVRWLPVVLLGAGLVVERFSAPEVSSVAFCLIAPVIAALWLSLVGTALIGLGAIFVDFAMLSHHGSAGSISELPSVAVVAGVAVFIHWLLRTRGSRPMSVPKVAARGHGGRPSKSSEHARLPAVDARHEAIQRPADTGPDFRA